MTDKIHDLDILYYRELYRKKILSSKPVICGKNGRFEIHILTCKNDLLDCLWCLKTFYHYSGLKPRLVVHSDGTLNAQNERTLLEHFINCSVIGRNEADCELKKYLGKYKFCSRYRFEDFSPYSIKLFDFFRYSRGGGILIMDSDVLFFRRPSHIIRSIINKKGFFLSGRYDTYSFSGDYLRFLFGINMFRGINSGLLYFPDRKYYDMDLLESYQEEACKKGYPKKYLCEQTAFALLISKYRKSFVKLAPFYKVSRQPLTGRTISHHFVSGRTRINLYREGLKRLKANGFLEEQLTAKPG